MIQVNDNHQSFQQCKILPFRFFPVKLNIDQGFDLIVNFVPFPGGTEVITEDDYQNGHPDLEAASSGRLGVGRDKMVYMAVKNHPKIEEDDDDDSDEDDEDDISMFFRVSAVSSKSSFWHCQTGCV